MDNEEMKRDKLAHNVNSEPDDNDWMDDDGEWDDEPDFSDDDETDEFELAMDECGQMADGFCMLAGTEHCDFECPFSAQMYANMTRKRDAKGRFCK